MPPGHPNSTNCTTYFCYPLLHFLMYLPFALQQPVS